MVSCYESSGSELTGQEINAKRTTLFDIKSLLLKPPCDFQTAQSSEFLTLANINQTRGNSLVNGGVTSNSLFS